jgi:hypothetical protein
MAASAGIKRRGIVPAELFRCHQPANERVAVGVRPRRGYPDQDITKDDIRARQNLFSFDGADREAREIVVLLRIKAGHFRRLTANQRAPGLAAALGDARDHGSRGVDLQLAAREIVEEKQRLGALHHEVVDAHGNEIDADRGVAARVDGDLELCADAVVRGH